ncbi:hypothetical protein GTO27_04275 [Candidatus Bathyarchaeota archaeon]|nr:hypothetical protein [Candidatus Bathyarchaeota archaeon]
MDRRNFRFIGLGLFGAFGLAILFSCHGLWFEQANQAEVIETASLPFSPTAVNSLRVSIPFAGLALILLSANAFVSTTERVPRKMDKTTFSLLSFILMIILGASASFLIPLASNWYVWLTTLIYGGVCAFSHQVYLSSIQPNKSMNTALSTHQNGTGLTKSLELEHNYLQSKLHWIIWGSIAFVTAGIVTVLFNPMEIVPKSVFNVYVTNTIVISTWCLIGIFLGIVVPMSTQMRYLREALVRLTTGQ